MSLRVMAPTLCVLGAIYLFTLAPGLTWWDAGELALAAHTYGIPHPPGTPLWVTVARAWHLLLPGVPTVLATNLLSAAATAAACAVLAWWVAQATDDRWSGVAAGIAAGVMASVWRNATETEVYSLALFVVALTLVAAHRAGTAGTMRWRLLTVYVLALGVAVHPATLVAGPAALVLAWPRPVAHGPRVAPREMIGAVVVGLLGLTALGILWVRAAHDPWLNQGNPASAAAWRDVLARAQYEQAGVWPRRAPWWAQLGMVVQYLDWQFALGAAESSMPTLARVLITGAALVVVVIGARWHARRDARTAWALLALAVGGTLGTALALNFKTGWSFSLGSLLDDAAREVRERDYFFAFGFAALGAWYGMGVRALAARHGRTAARAAALGILLLAIPVVGNWRAVRRGGSDAGLAEDYGRRILRELPARAVFVATGDNDLYPLWYLQAAEGLRPDVLVISEPLLATPWYRDELTRRHDVALPARWADAHALRTALVQGVRGRPAFVATLYDTDVARSHWVAGAALVHGHAEPFGRLAAAALREPVVVRPLLR